MDLECKKCKNKYHKSEVITDSNILAEVGYEYEGNLCRKCFDELHYKIDDCINSIHKED